MEIARGWSSLAIGYLATWRLRHCLCEGFDGRSQVLDVM